MIAYWRQKIKAKVNFDNNRFNCHLQNKHFYADFKVEVDFYGGF